MTTNCCSGDRVAVVDHRNETSPLHTIAVRLQRSIRVIGGDDTVDGIECVGRVVIEGRNKMAIGIQLKAPIRLSLDPSSCCSANSGAPLLPVYFHSKDEQSEEHLFPERIPPRPQLQATQDERKGLDASKYQHAHHHRHHGAKGNHHKKRRRIKGQFKNKKAQ
jgi:hypothetical protein